MPGLIHGLEAEQDPGQPRACARARGSRRGDPGRDEVRAAGGDGRARRRGGELVGENRLQDLEAKRERWGDAFTWDFIGNLQSRKVKRILPLVRLIHSVASDSVLEQLGRHGTPETEVLVEVNVAGEESKGGVAASRARERSSSAARCSVVGLMTMPPVQHRPRGLATRLRPPGGARRRARARAALDGHEPGLGGRRRGGRDDPAARHIALHLGARLNRLLQHGFLRSAKG